MNTVLCFGEILLRFSPLQNHDSFIQQHMPVFIGGAELNVAQALAQWNTPVAYCTAMPDNFLTESILQFIAKKKIDTTSVFKRGERMGVYYLAQGNDVKHYGAVFDRSNSSFATLQPGEINWKAIFKGKSWFHFSAIAASLSESTTTVCLEAVQAAKELGLTISIDLNYRSKLWNYGKHPTAVMPALVKYCDVIMGNLWSIESLLGILSPIKTSVGIANDVLIISAKQSMELVRQLYPLAKKIAYTFRLEESYFAVLQHPNGTNYSRVYEIRNVIDRVGSGDCFMAGLIYSMVHNESPQSIIDFAASAAVGKLYEKGDSTQQKIEQIISRYS
jgi:2-dehydro-3-deoxygluconokinase